MAIIREVLRKGEVEERQRLPIGHQEVVVPSIWGSGEETWVYVPTDDDLKVTYYYKTVYESKSDSYKELRSHTYHTNEINEHDIQTHPSLFKHKIVAFKWEPSHLHLTPDQERTIREMIANGTYSEEEAQQVR